MRPTTLPTPVKRRLLLQFIPALLGTAALAGCTGAGDLPAGLTARMDAPGALLDRTDAFAIINQFRAGKGVPTVTPDEALNTTAQALAVQYASKTTPPTAPGDVKVVRFSAGYPTFAETFSGWRNAVEDADALATTGVSRAGLGVAYDANSAYGVYWVLVFGA
jgi:Cysteine-rich secretory protein family